MEQIQNRTPPEYSCLPETKTTENAVVVVFAATLTANRMFSEYIKVEAQKKLATGISALEQTIRMKDEATQNRLDWVKPYFQAIINEDFTAYANFNILKNTYSKWSEYAYSLPDKTVSEIDRIIAYRKKYGVKALSRKIDGQSDLVTKGHLVGISRDTIADYINFEERVNESISAAHGFSPMPEIELEDIDHQITNKIKGNEEVRKLNIKQRSAKLTFITCGALIAATLLGMGSESEFKAGATSTESKTQSMATPVYELFSNADGKLASKPRGTKQPETRKLDLSLLIKEDQQTIENAKLELRRTLPIRHSDTFISTSPEYINLQSSDPKREQELLDRLNNNKIIRAHMLRIAKAQYNVLSKIEQTDDQDIIKVYKDINRANLDLVVGWIGMESGDFPYKDGKGYPNLYYINNRDNRARSLVSQMHEVYGYGQLQHGGVQIYESLTTYPKVHNLWEFLNPEHKDNPNKFRDHLQQLIDNSENNGVVASDYINIKYEGLISKFLTPERKIKSNQELGFELTTDVIAKNITEFNSSDAKNFFTMLVTTDPEISLLLNYKAVMSLKKQLPLIYSGNRVYGYLTEQHANNIYAWSKTSSLAYQKALIYGLIRDPKYNDPQINPAIR